MIYPTSPAIRRIQQVGLLARFAAAAMLLALLSPREGFAESETSLPPLPDYSLSELSALESLDELLPANLYAIEVIIFKRWDTSQSLLATAESLGQPQNEAQPPTVLQSSAEGNTAGNAGYQTDGSIDSREPLLLNVPRLLPANLYALSAPKGDDTEAGVSASDDEPQCWSIPDPLMPDTVPLSTAESLNRGTEQHWESVKMQSVESSLSLSSQLASDPGLLPQDESELVPPDGIGVVAPIYNVPADLTNPADLANDPSPVFVATRPIPLGESAVMVTPYLTLIKELTDFARLVDQDQYRRRPNAALTLSRQARRLEGSGEFQVMEHVAWHQPVPDRNAPQPIYIHLGDEIRGYLSVTLGRYLHTAATLWFSPTGQADNSQLSRSTAVPFDTQRPYAQLKQSRRMRSGELHYFDHPLFGVLVRIDKVKHPEAITNQFALFKRAWSVTKSL